MTGTEIYKRTATYEKEARDIRLHVPQWKLLLAYDGQRSLSEVALSGEMAFAEAIPLTQKFLDHKWIAEEPITLDQYLKRVNAKDISLSGAAVAPAVVLHEPKKEAPAPPASPTLAAPPVAPTPAPAAPSAAPTSGPAIVPPPLPSSPAPVASSAPTAPPPLATVAAPEKMAAPRTLRGPMKLSAVVDFITSLVGNISLGQLLVYRVFLRVPPELLLAEDIASVHLTSDTSLVQGEKLQKAIAEATSAVTKRTLPDSVYAAA